MNKSFSYNVVYFTNLCPLELVLFESCLINYFLPHSYKDFSSTMF